MKFLRTPFLQNTSGRLILNAFLQLIKLTDHQMLKSVKGIVTAKQQYMRQGIQRMDQKKLWNTAFKNLKWHVYFDRPYNLGQFLNTLFHIRMETYSHINERSLDKINIHLKWLILMKEYLLILFIYLLFFISVKTMH